MDLGACSPNSCCQRMERRKRKKKKEEKSQPGRKKSRHARGRQGGGADQMVVQLVPAWTGSRRKIRLSKTSMKTYKERHFPQVLIILFPGKPVGFSNRLHLQLISQLPKKVGQEDLPLTSLGPGQQMTNPACFTLKLISQWNPPHFKPAGEI